ncbi:MAG: glycosyltransferase [Oscillospiraceae bacterium]|nr:glycosyltransferase [Oscillospiraceae bacterium]
MPTISLCMIVKNEENNLERCLASIQDFVSQMVIVNTGSTDKTTSIARGFGAQIFDFVWTDHFAQARNFGLEKATGDWILWMDADEEMRMLDYPALQKLMLEAQRDLIHVPMVHYYGQLPADAYRSHLSASYRLFRNHKGIRFIGSIHEHLDLNGIEIPELCNDSPLSILHYGYLDSEIAMKDKGNRNLQLLLKEQKTDAQNPWLNYHIACEYCRLGKYSEGFQECNTAITCFLEKNLLPSSLVYKLKYDILITTGNTQNAWPGIEKAIALYPDYVDLHYYKGIILYMSKQYNMAAEAFEYCLMLGEENPQYLILRGAGSYYALYYLGVCYRAQNKNELAKQAFQDALAQCPLLKEAETQLAD